jgi:hypothetical protein
MNLIERLSVRGSELTVRPSRRLSLLLPSEFKIAFDPSVELAEMPPQIALLPFLWNVAPIVWAADQTFEIDALDPRVAESFIAVREELRMMYPSLGWRGEVRASQLVPAPEPPPTSLTAAALFSGGVDSTWTALSHAGPGLLLVSVWGADVRLSDPDTWRLISSRNAEFAARHAGAFSVVRSTFKSINYPRLSTLTPEIPNWWSHIQMTMGTAPLAAPVMYRHGISMMFVPATVTAEFRPNYASLPRLDEKVSLATAHVEHDGFGLLRQQKIERLVAWQRSHSDSQLHLRVCITWVTANGGNCGRCEKCVRTMVGLLLAGGDPVTFGFPDYRPAILDRVPTLFPSRRFRFMEEEVFMWQDLQAHVRRRDDLHGPFWSWLREFDFERYRLSQPVGWLTWARINPWVARTPRLVAAARGARRLARRMTPRT